MLRSQRRVYDGSGEVARMQDVWGAEGISGRVNFLPLAWAGMPKTSFRKNSDSPVSAHFNRQYELHCKHLMLKGLQPRTIDAYSCAMWRVGEYFNYQLEHLTQVQLLDYFHDLLDRLSWSAVKLGLYGLKFFYTQVLQKNLDRSPINQAS
ncbi:MAG: phage integrase N-terminal SAM-like domain-containing protein [Methyloprofundus sp.]